MLPLLLALVGTAAAVPLSFQDLFDRSAPTLQLSARARELSGKRIRVVGYMAHSEEPPTGAFWLCPHPVMLDESGAGIGDLPVESIRVILSPPGDGPVPPLAQPLAVEGTFEVGRRVEEDGTVSSFRILLDPARPRRTWSPSSAPPARQGRKSP